MSPRGTGAMCKYKTKVLEVHQNVSDTRFNHQTNDQFQNLVQIISFFCIEYRYIYVFHYNICNPVMDTFARCQQESVSFQT